MWNGLANGGLLIGSLGDDSPTLFQKIPTSIPLYWVLK